LMLELSPQKHALEFHRRLEHLLNLLSAQNPALGRRAREIVADSVLATLTPRQNELASLPQPTPAPSAYDAFAQSMESTLAAVTTPQGVAARDRFREL